MKNCTFYHPSLAPTLHVYDGSMTSNAWVVFLYMCIQYGRWKAEVEKLMLHTTKDKLVCLVCMLFCYRIYRLWP